MKDIIVNLAGILCAITLRFLVWVVEANDWIKRKLRTNK